MQTPEINNFPAPESLFFVKNFQGSPSFKTLKISSFHYSHSLTVIIPELQNLPQQFFKPLLEKSIFYKITDLDLNTLVSLTFISNFIKNGKLTLLSINKRIDCDNCIGITPDNKFYLSLNKESYQSFGVEGVVSHFTKKLDDRYLVSIDLADEKLLSNKLKLQRLSLSLKSLEKFTVLVFWDPPDQDICPSSIAKYFSDLGYAVRDCTPSLHSHALSTRLPRVNFNAVDKIDTSIFVEWLGLVALQCNLERDDTDYLSSYIMPDAEEEDVKKVDCFQLRGFFPSTIMSENIEYISKLLENSQGKWMAIYVQGFSDCPVAFGNEEHHYFTHGDNGYILIFDKEKGIVCMHKCSRRRYK